MTDAEKLAYTVTRERIVKQIDQLKASGGSDSVIKRLGRFGNAFSWYPEFYPQILADINGMSDAELMSALRTEEGFMKLIAPVEGLPIHHKVANRTGGDLPIRTPTDTFLDVRKMFFDKYGGFPGNSGWNLGAQGAFDERMHQGRYGAKGTAFDPRFGYGMPPTEELPIAHGKGTKNIGRALGEDPTLLRSTAQEIFESLDEFVKPQIAKFQEIATNPVTLGQRAIIQKAIDVDAFAEGRTIEQSTAVREAAKLQGLDIEFAKGFKYDFTNAAAKLVTDPEAIQRIMRFPNRLMQEAQGMQSIQQINRAIQNPAARRFGAAVPFVGAGLGAAFVGANRQARLEEIQQNPQDPTLKANLVLDELSGQADRATLAGAALLPTPAAPVGAAMIGAGELTSTVTGVASLAIDGGRAFIKSIFNPPKREEQKLVPDLPNLR
jgi:hypothetical protein